MRRLRASVPSGTIGEGEGGAGALLPVGRSAERRSRAASQRVLTGRGEEDRFGFAGPVLLFLLLGYVAPLRDPQGVRRGAMRCRPLGDPGLLRAAPPCSSQGRPAGADRVVGYVRLWQPAGP